MSEHNKQENASCLRWAIGCSSFLFVVTLGLTAVAYFVVRTVDGGVSNLRDVVELSDLESTVINQTEFIPPGDGMLTLEQVDSLAYIFSEIRQVLGAHHPEFYERFPEIEAKLSSKQPVQRLRSLMELDASVLTAIKAAKEAEVDALNKISMSNSEYDWVWKAVAVTLGFENVNDRLYSVFEPVEDGESESQPNESMVSVNPQNAYIIGTKTELFRQILGFKLLGI
jgi:hypothetical protein